MLITGILNMSRKKFFIKYGSHYIDKQDIKNVTETLKSDFLTQGDKVKKFEKNLAGFLNAKYAISCSSGTAAIHIAMKALNLNSNSTVIMPVINFVSAYNVSKNLNCKIFFCDVDRYSGLITPQTIIECINKYKLKKIDLLFIMHHGGHVCDLQKINMLKKKFKFFIIEDACHALGSSYFIKKKKFKVGCGLHSDIITFSFHPIKAITTGEGGALVTNNYKLATNSKLIRSHGIKRSTQHWVYDVQLNGLNYRLSDIAAALGVSQLKKIKKFLNQRRRIAKNYFKFIKTSNSQIRLPDKKFVDHNSWHLFTIQINFEKLNFSKSTLFEFMLKKKIILQQHYIPNHLFKVCRKIKKNKFENAIYFYKNSFSLPIHYKLKKTDQLRVVKELHNYIKNKK